MRFEGNIAGTEIERIVIKILNAEFKRLESKLGSYEKFLNKFYEELKVLI